MYFTGRNLSDFDEEILKINSFEKFVTFAHTFSTVEYEEIHIREDEIMYTTIKGLRKRNMNHDYHSNVTRISRTYHSSNDFHRLVSCYPISEFLIISSLQALAFKYVQFPFAFSKTKGNFEKRGHF